MPVDWQVFQREDGSFIESGFCYVDNAILWAKENKLNLILDLHKSILGAREFSGQSMRLVVGSKDPSADIASQFSELSGERFSVEILDGVDHNFTDAQDLFASLPEKYLFGE